MMGLESTGRDLDAALEVFAADLLYELLPSVRKLRSPRYERWLSHSERLLAARGYVSFHEDAASADLAWQRWTQWKAQQQCDAAMREKVELLEEMLQSLPKILSARMRATQVLFPGGSTRRAEALYQCDAAAKRANRALADALVGYVHERTTTNTAAPRLDVLEVGAGTGATTAAVLSVLTGTAGAEVSYCYTDVSNAFLARGRRKFAQSCPGMSFRLFDLERPPVEQQIEAASFDVVIAANVLHATRDVRRAVGHVRKVLRDGGVLLMNELKGTDLFLHLTFGLLDGWALYQDEELRLPCGPAISGPMWQRVLLECGFHAIEFPEQGPAGNQSTIVARATPQH